MPIVALVHDPDPLVVYCWSLRAAREAEEAEARRVSELIDEQLRLENQPKNPSVKVLLLGQEGASALIKAFLELYAPQAWEENRLLSRAIVYLDLIRSVDKILDVLEDSPDTPHWVKLLRMRLIPLCATQRDLEADLALAEAYAAAIAPEHVKQRQHHKPDRRSISEGRWN
ncbi:hypothetical protein BGW80DRAFT_1455758 [Lactifluus volemus]|nr:hypothetical protein BGW80DRAFT_1455758 [Lactifluus volemus]